MIKNPWRSIFDSSPGRKKVLFNWVVCDCVRRIRLCLEEDEMVGEKEKKNGIKRFGIINLAVLAFGIFAQILSEMMGYTPLLTNYFLHLLPSVAESFFAYYLMVKFRKGSKALKIILTVFLIIIFAWSVFMNFMFADVQFDDYYQREPYGNGWYFGWANRKEEAQYMLSKCHLFGQGDAYYEYPDDLIDPNVWIIDDLPVDVQNAMKERDRAEIFLHFRWDMLLPVLAYTYGFWITILFAAITIAWCVSAIAAFRKLNVWWEKILYAVCGALIAEQMIFPLLGGLGIIACLTPHPFSMDWEVTLLTVIPQLSVMFALLNSSHPKSNAAVTLLEVGESKDEELSGENS